MLSQSSRSATDLTFFSAPKLSKAVASTSTSVSVSTRLPHPPPPKRTASATKAVVPPSSSPLSSARSSPIPVSEPDSKKRKKLGDLPSSASTTSSDLPRQVKRLRTSSSTTKRPRGSGKRAASSSSKSSRASSHQRTLPPSPEPIYRSGSRSRSTSHLDSTESQGPSIQIRKWGVGEDVAADVNLLSSEMVVKGLMKSYKAYFSNPNDPNDRSFEPHPTNYPVVELEYPNGGASERFILLAPKDKDHYNPIMDLERSLYTMVECYFDEEEQEIFGPIPNASLAEDSPPSSRSPSPNNLDPNDTPSPASSYASLSSSPSKESHLSALRAIADSYSDDDGLLDRLPVLRAVQRAIHLQDGPLFMAAMARVNKILHSIKYPPPPDDGFLPIPKNPMMSVVEEKWTQEGLPEKVLMRIIEENYQRTVGPNVPKLKHYEAFSSTVYGELMPSLAKDIIEATGVNEDSLFLDLGSGVGNVVVQASLQTGCTSYGIELMPHPARVARDTAEQIRIRAAMWGVRIGEMELEEGNMLESRRLDELLTKADVVLVDNKVFEESLNEALRPKFLDLKEGACVVSLKPFVSSINARLTKRNVDDISAIFDVEEKPYYPGGVSWGNSGGSYYIHRMDREGYAKIKERFDSLHGGSGRSSRSRR